MDSSSKEGEENEGEGVLPPSESSSSSPSPSSSLSLVPAAKGKGKDKGRRKGPTGAWNFKTWSWQSETTTPKALQIPEEIVRHTPEVLQIPEIVRLILDYVDNPRTFRLVHPIWNEAVLCHPIPRFTFQMTVLQYLSILPEVLKLMPTVDARIGRAMVMKDEDDLYGGQALTLIKLTFDTNVQELRATFDDSHNSFLLFARLLQQDSFPKLKSLDLTFFDSFPEISPERWVNEEVDDDDDDDDESDTDGGEESGEESKHYAEEEFSVRHLLSSLKVTGSFGIDTDKHCKNLENFVQRVLNSAPNLLDVSLSANISPCFTNNLKMKRLDCTIDFSSSSADSHAGSRSAEHYVSAQSYVKILNNLGVLSGCLESFRFRCEGVDSSCTTCKKMIMKNKNTSFPVAMNALKSLELYNPILSKKIGNGVEVLTKCLLLPQLRKIVVLGQSLEQFKAFQPVFSQAGKNLLPSGGLNHIPVLRNLTFLTMKCSIFLKTFRPHVPFFFLKTLHIKHLVFEDADVFVNRLTNVLNHCAALGLEHLSLGLQGPLKLATLIEAFSTSRIFDSRSLQILDIVYTGGKDIDIMCKDGGRREPGYLRHTKMFESVLGRVKHMKDVTFTNFAMPACMTAALAVKITKEKLPVRFLAEHKIFSERFIYQ